MSSILTLLQVHWDIVKPWIKSIIGGSIEVAFDEIRFADGTEVLWHFIGADYGVEDNSLVFRDRTHTRIGSDRKLDVHLRILELLQSSTNYFV